MAQLGVVMGSLGAGCGVQVPWAQTFSEGSWLGNGLGMAWCALTMGLSGAACEV